VSKKIIVGSDRLAIQLKDAIVEHLQTKYGYEVVDVGMKRDDTEVMPFFDVAPRVCEPIQRGEFDRGIVLCGSGAGVSMISNKHKGIYAVLCQSPYESRMCRIVNNANVLALGGNLTTPAIGVEIADAFINTEFTEGLPEDRQDFMKGAFQKVQDLEGRNFK
jgi:ribose 5-phosphate isomerase B